MACEGMTNNSPRPPSASVDSIGDVIGTGREQADSGLQINRESFRFNTKKLITTFMKLKT